MGKRNVLRWWAVLLVMALLLTGCANSPAEDQTVPSGGDTVTQAPAGDTEETTQEPTQESTMHTGPIELPVIPG